MHMEYYRLNGEHLGKFSFGRATGANDFQEPVLRQWYGLHFDSDEKHFWPKPQYGLFGTKAVPETVALFGDDGEKLLSYDLLDLIKFTGLELRGVAPNSPH